MKKRKFYWWQISILIVVFLTQLLFVFQKEGYHMDEMLTFQLSNAEYNPWIVPTQPVGRLAKFMKEEVYGDTFFETSKNVKDVVVDVLENKRESTLFTYKADVYEEPIWISNAQFKDYILVEEKDDFSYLSVYFNVKDDNHPPLHFMLVHTLSSLFKGQLFPLLGCVINIGAVLGCIIVMFCLGNLLEKYGILLEGDGAIFSGASGLMYGLSAGAISTTLLIRMYGLMTLFCMILFYIHLKKFLEGSFDKKNKLLIIVTILGFVNQYFFLFYCILLALVTVLVLCLQERKKEAFIYIKNRIIAAVFGIAIFPFAIGDVFASERGVEALTNLSEGFLGYGQRILSFGGILLARVFGNTQIGGFVLLVIFVLIIMIATGKLKTNKKIVCRNLLDCKICFGWMYIIPVVGYFLLTSRMAPILTDRYIMPLFPFTIMGIIFALIYIANQCKREIRIPFLFLGIMLLALFQVRNYDGTYLYKGYEKQLEIAKEYEKSALICIYDGFTFYDNLLEFALYEKTLLVKKEELEERADRETIEELEQVVVLVKNAIEKNKAIELLQDFDFTLEEVLLEEGAHGDSLYLFIKSQ